MSEPDTHPDAPDLLNTEEAARYLRLSPGTLIVWRSRRQGPPYVKIGGRVFYLPAELDAFISHRNPSGAL